MNAMELIAAKKAQRVSQGFALRINFDKRSPFNGFYATKEQFNENFESAKLMIGKRGPDGMTVVSVEVL